MFVFDGSGNRLSLKQIKMTRTEFVVDGREMVGFTVDGSDGEGYCIEKRDLTENIEQEILHMLAEENEYYGEPVN